jgi:hypothetical protein
LKDEIIEKLIEDLNNVEEDPLSSEALETMLHTRGIGMRHLGRICTNVSEPSDLPGYIGLTKSYKGNGSY